MRRPPEPLFLAKQSYRSRRLGDAARALPAIGAILLLLPILWADTARTREGMVYVFAVWVLLIVIVAPISARLSDHSEAPEQPPPDDAAKDV